jgi:hypothetical protein
MVWNVMAKKAIIKFISQSDIDFSMCMAGEQNCSPFDGFFQLF